VRKPFRNRNILIVLMACVLGAVVLNEFFGREPSFEGKRLSEWIWTMNGKEAGTEKEKARAVVRMLGTNSLPLLLDWLQQEDSPSMTARFDAVRHRAFFWLVGHKLISNRGIASLRDFNPSHRAMALWALPELDPVGKRTAIPTLIQMLGDKKHKADELSHAAGIACLVLSKMAPESIDPLMVALSSQDKQVRLLAAGALGEIGPDAKAAIPILEKGLAEKDPNIRAGIALVIGKLGGEPDSFVPVIIRALPEMDRDNLGYYLNALLVYKEQAKAAVPVLEAMLNKTTHSTNRFDYWVRGEVINTLRQINPASTQSLTP
jgi:HEAT repeat protein